MPGTALWVDGFICLPVSPFICLPLSPRLDAWHGSLGGRVRLSPWVHLSPFVSLHLSPVVSQPGWSSLGGRVHLSPFVICLPLSPSLAAWHGSLGARVHLSPFVWRGSGTFVSLCLPSFVSRCLPAWMPGWTDSLVSLCLPSFVARCLPAWIWHGSLGGRVHVSPFVPFICLPFSPSLDAWHGSLGGRVHLSLFVSLDFSRCLPAWMPGTALWVDGFICLPLSPFICLPLSPSLDAWRGSLGGRVHLSTFVSQDVWHPFVSLHLSPVVSQPGCLALFFGGQTHFSPFVSLHLAPVVSQPGCLSRQADGFTCLPWFPFICLPSLWVDGFICFPLSPFICLPLSPSLDAWHGSLGGRIHLSPVVSQPGCVTHAPRFPSLPAVLSFWRGLVCLRLWPLGTGSSSVCPSSGLRFRLGSWWVVFLVYRWLHPVCSFSASLSVAVPS